jgi:hypothetical protein
MYIVFDDEHDAFFTGNERRQVCNCGFHFDSSTATRALGQYASAKWVSELLSIHAKTKEIGEPAAQYVSSVVVYLSDRGVCTSNLSSFSIHRTKMRFDPGRIKGD